MANPCRKFEANPKGCDMIQHLEQKPGCNLDFTEDRLRANPEEIEMKIICLLQSGTSRLTQHCRWVTKQLFVNGLVAVTCTALFLPFATHVRAAERQLLHGHIPEAEGRLRPVDRLPGINHLNLGIALPLCNEEALAELIHELYDPASTNYHQYLTVEQFTERFGPTEADYQKVKDYVKSCGMKVTSTYASRMYLDVDGAVEDIERVFHITMRVYQPPGESRKFYSQEVEPSIDLDVPVSGINGLDNYTLPHPMNLRKAPVDEQVISYATGSGPGTTFIGNDFRAAYVPGTALNGSGQTIGLVSFGPYSPNSITSYETTAGLSTSIPVRAVSVNLFNTNWVNQDDGETCLDIEMSISMAPGASVWVYEGNGFGSILSQMANDNVAKQISCSYGVLPAPAGMEGTFLQMAAQGQSFFSASGDRGAYSTNAIFAPDESTNITVVGGTTL